MFAERAAPVLAEAKAIEAMPSQEQGMSIDAVTSRVAAKNGAKQTIDVFTPMLYPDDETVN